MENLKNSIKEAMEVINLTTALFYQQKNQEGFQELEHTLNVLMQAVDGIITYQAGKSEKLLEEQIFNAVLTEAMKAIEQKDTILLADILIFEVNEMLEECLKRI